MTLIDILFPHYLQYFSVPHRYRVVPSKFQVVLSGTEQIPSSTKRNPSSTEQILRYQAVPRSKWQFYLYVSESEPERVN